MIVIFVDRTRAMCTKFDVKYVLALVISLFSPLANGQESTIATTTIIETAIETSTDNSNSVGETPYQVSLHYTYNDEFICGGSIISSKIVLTAAHCMYYKWGGLMPPLIVAVSAGRKNLNESAVKVFTVDNITLHPSFNMSTMKNDLAVLEVSDAFPTNDLIRSVSLEKSIEPGGQYNSCIISGWNKDTYNLEVTDVVTSSCDTFPDHICTTMKNEYDTVCINGAGNPLICDGKLVGVLSVEPDCTDPSRRTIFENVRNSMSWLNEFDMSPSSAKLPIFSCMLLLLTVSIVQL